MNGISISLVELLIKGVPESFLIVLALHFFTHTKVDPPKYVLLSFIYVITTYLIRLLPIQLGINTLLSMLAMILLFQTFYKGQLEKVAKAVASAVIIFVFIMISEVINIYLLQLLFGEQKTLELLSENNPIIKSISTIPSTIFTAVFIFTGRGIMNYIDARKKKNGETGE